MKRVNLIIFVFSIAALFAFVSCSKKDDGNGGVVATTPQPCNAYGPQGIYPNDTCPHDVNNPNYAYYNQNYQWTNSPWQWPNQINIYATNCGCSSGYVPTFEAGYGVACVPMTYFGNTISYWYNIGYFPGPSVNGQWLNIPQMTYSQANQACFKSLAVGCDVRMNNCPAGQSCQSAAAGSAIGICR